MEGWFVSHQKLEELLCFWLLITTSEPESEVFEHRFILCTKCQYVVCFHGSWTGGLCQSQVCSYFYKLEQMILTHPLSDVYIRAHDINLFVHVCCRCSPSSVVKGSELAHQLAECYVEPWHVSSVGWIFLMSRTHISTDSSIKNAGSSLMVLTWRCQGTREKRCFGKRKRNTWLSMWCLKALKPICNCPFYDITADPQCPCCCGAAFQPQQRIFGDIKPIETHKCAYQQPL